MSNINMSKVKSKLAGLKDKIENEEDRQKVAQDSLREVEAQLNANEEEAESFKRRTTLVQEHLERANKAYNEKAQKLEDAKERFRVEEELRVDLDNSDRDNDDEIARLEGNIAEAKQYTDEGEEKLSVVLQKLKVVAIDLQKAYERADASEEKADKLQLDAQAQGEHVRDLEERDFDAVDKEQDCEQIIALIKEELDEKTQRIEDAERKVPPIELYSVELITETRELRKLKDGMEGEMRDMADYGDDSDEETPASAQETEDTSDPHKETEPEDEAKEPEPDQEPDKEAEETRESDDDQD